MKQGGAPFAPTLQVSVEADLKRIETARALSSVADRLDEDTETLVKAVMEFEG